MKKGFDTKQAREYFRVLRKSSMILHGNFIVGLVGENEAEMLEIAPFARELGVDTLTVRLLRTERYSALNELVTQTPGYHIGPDSKIYSDQYPPERLSRIRGQIFRGFYTSGQILRVGKKIVQNRMFTLRMLASLSKFLLRALQGRFNPEEGKGVALPQKALPRNL